MDESIESRFARLKESNASLRAALDAHQNDPVCGDHAETWYCERPTVTFTPTEDAPQGCFLCEIASLKAERDHLVTTLVRIFEWSDASYLHADLHVENAVNNLRADLAVERADLARVRGQRDKALIDLALTKHDVLFPDRPIGTVVELVEHHVRILDRDGTRTVEEIES